MTSTPHYAHCDTKHPNGTYVQIERVLIEDDSARRPDEMQDGFWPSLDPDDAGYIGPKTEAELAAEQAKCKRRMADYEAGARGYVGVIARAKCLIVRDGVGTYVNIDSPGLWGIESDAGDYLNEVYREQCEDVKQMLADLAVFTIESE